MLGFDFISMPEEHGVLVGSFTVAFAMIWYAQAQVRWFMHDLRIGVQRATAIFLAAFLFATLAALLVALVITFDARSIATSV